MKMLLTSETRGNVNVAVILFSIWYYRLNIKIIESEGIAIMYEFREAYQDIHHFIGMSCRRERRLLEESEIDAQRSGRFDLFYENRSKCTSR